MKGKKNSTIFNIYINIMKKYLSYFLSNSNQIFDFENYTLSLQYQNFLRKI